MGFLRLTRLARRAKCSFYCSQTSLALTTTNVIQLFTSTLHWSSHLERPIKHFVSADILCFFNIFLIIDSESVKHTFNTTLIILP